MLSSYFLKLLIFTEAKLTLDEGREAHRNCLKNMQLEVSREEEICLSWNVFLH